MKKMLIVIALSITVFVMASCGGRDENVLRVGMDLGYPPFETRDNNDEPMGISVDVAYMLGEYLGREVEIVDTDFGSLIPALNSGGIDVIIASMSKTESRMQSIDFSDPYFVFNIISLVNADFANQNGITPDSTKEDLLMLDEIEFVGLSGQVSATIPEEYDKEVTIATNLGTAILGVAQGSSDVLLMSPMPVTNGNRAHPEDTIVVWDVFDPSPIAMGVRQGDDELLSQINAFIATMSEPGGAYEQLHDKWNEHIEGLLERYGFEYFIYED